MTHVNIFSGEVETTTIVYYTTTTNNIMCCHLSNTNWLTVLQVFTCISKNICITGCLTKLDKSEPAQVLTINISFYSTPPDMRYIPPYVPADLAPRLIRFHGHPFAWWAGQFLKYILRPQPSLATEMKNARKVLGYRSPIVG